MVTRRLVDHVDPNALLTELLSNTAADAGGATSDDGNFLIRIHTQLLSLSFIETGTTEPSPGSRPIRTVPVNT